MNLTNAMVYQIVMMVQMNLGALQLVLTSVQTNSSNARIPGSVSLKGGIAMVHPTAKTILMNHPVVAQLNAQTITSNVTTKNVSTKVLYVMVKMTVVIILMNPLLMVVVHPKLKLVHLANGLVPA